MTSREMISSSSGVRPNQQPTTVTSEKVRPGGNEKVQRARLEIEM